MINEKVFFEIMTALGEIFDKKLSDTVLEFYYKTLSQKMDTNQFKKVASIWIEKGKFFPKPAELLQLLDEIEGSQAERAWLQVLEEIERVGITGSPNFKDPVIYAVVQAMGGWENLCNMPVDRQPFYMKDFVNLYTTYKDKPDIIRNALPASKQAEIKALGQIMRRALGRGDN